MRQYLDVMQKILDEEQFHLAHGRAWFARLARAGGEARAELAAAVSRYMPHALAWFGPESDAAKAFRNASIRRDAGTAPDEETIRRIRGDKNRAFLMD